MGNYTGIFSDSPDDDHPFINYTLVDSLKGEHDIFVLYND